MKFGTRSIDPVAFWNRYVDLPDGTRPDRETFSALVQCPNPSHDTTKKHFQVNLHEPKVHCFAHCGISGSYEHAVCVIEGLYEKFDVDLKAVSVAFEKNATERSKADREQIRRWKKARDHGKKLILKNAPKFHGKISVSKKAHSRGSTEAVRPIDLSFDRYLPPLALDYLAQRGITDSSVSKWGLGWLPEDKRVAIPALDVDQKLRFLIKRGILEKQQPKYLYTEGFPKTSLLFGACALDLGLVHSDGLILVEGSLDTILMHQHGLLNTVGILGTGISDQQVRIIERLRPKKITFAFDRDSAGMRNIEIASRKLRKYPLYVMRYPKGKHDPAELSKEEANRQISKAMSYRMFKARTAPRRKEMYGTHKV